MIVPKSVIPLIGVILFIVLGAFAIHFLATNADAAQALTKTYSNPASGFMTSASTIARSRLQCGKVMHAPIEWRAVARYRRLRGQLGP
jgi:uncharacterized membrane protein (DUF485 family)